MRYFFLSAFALLLAACTNDKAAPEADVATWQVNSRRVDCTGVAPMKCLQVRENAAQPWRNHFAPIEGFEYEEGYLYEIKIKTTKVENPPADGSSLRYTLVAIVKREKDPAALILDTPEAVDAWMAAVLQGESGYTKKSATVNRGDAANQTTAYTDDAGAVRMLRVETPGKMPAVHQYFAHDGKVVLLRELIAGGTKNVENRFYFANGRFLQALSKTVPGRMAPEGVPFGPYESPYGDLDFRTKFDQVQASYTQFLAGK